MCSFYRAFRQAASRWSGFCGAASGALRFAMPSGSGCAANAARVSTKINGVRMGLTVCAADVVLSPNRLRYAVITLDHCV